MKRNFMIGLWLLTAWLFNAGTVAAEIFKWTDDAGRIHYTDKPPPQVDATTVKVKINTYSSPEIIASPTSLASAKAAGNRQVILYSTSWCGYCKKARNYFNKNNIAFTEYDVEKSARGKRDYKAMNGTAVPIILVGDKRMNGFSPATFVRLYDG
jgi:glutaredoxin